MTIFATLLVGALVLIVTGSLAFCAFEALIAPATQEYDQ